MFFLLELRLRGGEGEGGKREGGWPPYWTALDPPLIVPHLAVYQRATKGEDT